MRRILVLIVAVIAVNGIMFSAVLAQQAPPAVTAPEHLAQAPPTPEPAAKEPEPERWLLMGLLKDTSLGHGLESSGVQIYGWIQQGFAGNADSPRDRVNFGANFDWRSNDYRLNQVYVVLENMLEHEDTFNLGYRVDFLAGHDAPFFVANGLLSDFTGFDASSGVGVDGPKSFREVNRVGIDFPQFYVEAHFPRVLTPGGIDVRVGKFYTLMGRDVYPAVDTDFYSRGYENVYATPFTHTGGMVTWHATPALDVLAGVVLGWDVFKDNNDMVSFHGGVIWNSSDKRYNWTTAWITGPEQPDDNHDYRTLITSYLTAKLGPGDAWVVSGGWHLGYESNGAVDAQTGARKDAKWYGTTIDVFYSVDPKLRLGTRAEWFRDEQGTRTAQLGRPGFAASFFELTMGVTYKPDRSVSIRPELRFDYSPDARPYNDQTSRFQFVPAIDVIVRF
jgi:putative OmpL-like beta-barrel porin-2